MLTASIVTVGESLHNVLLSPTVPSVSDLNSYQGKATINTGSDKAHGSDRC